MKNINFFSALLFGGLLSFHACESVLFDDVPEDLPTETFDAVWTFTDEYYCYFDFKGVDWDSVRTVYEPLVSDDMSSDELFEVCANMLNELRDGHVNLSSATRRSFYDNVFLHPINFNFSTVANNYLIQGDEPTWKDYGSFEIVLLEGDIIYAYYRSFNNSVLPMADIIDDFPEARGMILDIRDNGGGGLDLDLAGYFTDSDKLVAFYSQKNGPGHDAFTDLLPVTVEPTDRFFSAPVVLLTNRGCYSAASNFTQYMKEFPNVTQLGDTTGGGAGSPIDYDLPNGWEIRVSHSPFVGADGFNFEEGTPPDIMGADDPTTLDVDEMIEQALDLLND
jgi:hypothetical protein